MKNDEHIYLARHGETLWNKLGIIQGRLNSGLTVNGIHQAKQLGEFFNKNNIIINVIFISPLLRVSETLKYILLILNYNIKIIEVDDFSEVDSGDFNGKKSSSIKESFHAIKRNNDKFNVAYPNGESYSDVYRRVNKSINIVKEYKAKNKLIISHEGVNKMIISSLIYKNNPKKTLFYKQLNNQLFDISGVRVKKINIA